MTAVRYQVPVTVQSDVNGGAVFVFPDVVQSLWVIGTVSIANAPGDAIFTASVAGTPWGTWYGPTPSPQIQVDGRLHCEVAAGFLNPSTNYVAWFIGWADDNPNLISPAAGGPLQLTQANQLIFNANLAIATALPNQMVFPAIQPWMQCLMIRWDDIVGVGGAFPGAHIRVVDLQSQGVYLDENVGSSVATYVPINGRPVSIALAAIPLSATHSGELTVTALAGPVVEPAGFWNGDVAQGRNGPVTVGVVQGIGVACAANATTTVVPAPPDGYCLRVKRLLVNATTAMAAGTILTARGSASAQIFGLYNMGLNGFFNETMDVWLPQGDGIVGNNTSAVTPAMRAWYEIWPELLAPI